MKRIGQIYQNQREGRGSSRSIEQLNIRAFGWSHSILHSLGKTLRDCLNSTVNLQDNVKMGVVNGLYVGVGPGTKSGCSS